MLIELAIGDAYGAGFEYVSNTIVKRSNNLSKYVQHPRHVITPGVYTDDTQMAIAIVELILSGEQWSPETYVITLSGRSTNKDRSRATATYPIVRRTDRIE